MNLERIGFVWPYYLLLFVGVALPSDGQHGILSLKGSAFLSACLCLFSFILIRRKFHMEHFSLLVFSASALAFLSTWFLIGALYGETPLSAQADQAKLFLTTLAFPLATLYLIREGLTTPQQVLKAILYCSLVYMLLKVVLVTLHLLGLIHLWSLLDAFGFRFMRMLIYGGLERLQTSVDILPPFLIFFVLISNRLRLQLKNRFKYTFVLFSLFSTFLSFSRTLLVIYALSWMLYGLTLDRRKMVKIGLALGMVSSVFILMLGPSTTYQIMEKRFFSRESILSDDYRKKQIAALLEEFNAHPVLGKGLGGFATSYVRDHEMPHHYEVQGLAFLMQFGVFGTGLLCVPLLWIAFRTICAPFSRERWALFALFALWLLAGFTNPFLISLSSGVVYALFILAPAALSDRRKEWTGAKKTPSGAASAATSLPFPTTQVPSNLF